MVFTETTLSGKMVYELKIKTYDGEKVATSTVMEVGMVVYSTMSFATKSRVAKLNDGLSDLNGQLASRHAQIYNKAETCVPTKYHLVPVSTRPVLHV